MSATEKLISLVKPHPCLYNTREKDYRNAMKKELLWEKIAKELKQSRDATKVKWKNLKDGYTKYKKNVKGTTGQKKTYNNWVWAPYLQFLDDYIEPRPTTSNITKDAQRLTISPSQSPPSTQESSPDPWTPLSDVPSTSVQFNSPDPSTPLSEMLSTSVETPPMVLPPIQTPSKKRMSNDQDGMDKILDFLKSKKKKHDAVDHLFASYAESFKNLKPRTQASVKLKLAEIFVEAELEDLDSDNQLSPTTISLSRFSPVYSLISAVSENQEQLEIVPVEAVDLTLVADTSCYES